MIPLTHAHLEHFLRTTVDIPEEQTASARKRVSVLHDALAQHAAAADGFEFVKLLNSGSMAKGTAVRPLTDVDLAIHLRPTSADLSAELPRAQSWVLHRLREGYEPGRDPDLVTIGRHAVRIRFTDPRLRVDVVPVLVTGTDEYGFLARNSGAPLRRTSIRTHLQVIDARSKDCPTLRQLIRLAKWWRQTNRLRIRSFAVELLCAHLVDRKLLEHAPQDLVEMLLQLFAYIVRSELRETIAPPPDPDSPADPPEHGPPSPVRILDPADPANNVAGHIREGGRRAIVETAGRSLEALAAARTAASAADAERLAQRVFGAAFRLDGAA